MLLETQKITQEAVEKAETLFLYCDPAGKIILCNKRMEEMVAINRESIIGNDLLKVLYHRICSRQNNEKLFKAMFDDAVKYKRSSVFEAVLIDGSTDEHVICWQTSPILTANKELEGVLFLGNDVTELKERETSIKTIDETLKNIFLSIKEYGLYTTNLEGNITYYGMGSEEMFGWKRDEIIFKHISVLHNYDDISYKLSFILEQVRNFGRYELESYFIKKDGQTFPVNLTVTKFIDSNGDMSGYIFMARDITEKRKLEYQIFQSEKLAAVGQLIAGLAHEINNPVFVISGRTDMMLADKLIGRRVKSELKIINNQIDQIRKLVDRFLAFTRKASPNQVELDINKVIKNVLPLLSYHKLPTHEIKTNKIFAKDLPKVRGDMHQLQEVFVNLLINAYQSMPNGGTATIKTSRLANEHIEVTITDTGCGIPADALRNLFMPFFSTKKEGTGLGLSICYNIIKNHGGSISVESQLGRGTIFTIKLPFVQKGGN